ncbi:hypothetical protein C8A00DRAFT_16082 [Chaetomidium leptoderma]|uniref:Cytochrome b5 heme-binding domain-containing protein n=1 Tax=Chaetomidium leptoderma TaxID=669021 RepID=A0AAN6ZVN0_9PEZI|nr:hypothetical protein C8A00DRAFT_16082 [Chaetomidium leptoderma]
MADETSVRRRKPEPKATTSSLEPDLAESQAESQDEKVKKNAPKKAKKKSKNARDQLDDDETYTSGALSLDIFRVLTFLILASCGLSYLVSSGESFFWGLSDPAKYLRPDWWKRQLSGPIYLTPTELLAYDGSDPSKPIYLAINGTIYDVSANPGTYGPGGSYHYFAGCDAARAYVTGCFAEDRTPDMRGAEDMYLPLDDPVVDRHWSPAELAALKKQEREAAEKRVHDGLSHWVGFFKGNPRYDFVGYVKKPAGWPGTEPRRQLCASAAKGRKKRVVPGQGK